MTDLTTAAIAAGIENFRSTHLARGGTSDAFALPSSFAILLQHAPAAFAGYGLMRASIMRDRPEGALDLKTKELIFTLLDVVLGAKDGAKAHAGNAVRLGLTLPELAEGLVQCLMAGGVTTWNLVGREVMEHAHAVAEEVGKTG